MPLPSLRYVSARSLAGVLLLSVSLSAGGCSIKQLALTAVADELSGGTGGSFSSDADLQFVGDALPFALKLMEGIQGAVPEHVGMHLTLASGFTQYGVVYVEWPAAQLKYEDLDAYQAGLTRARGFYLRANDYALGGLDLLHPGFRDHILIQTETALKETTVDDVPFLYWAAASWMAAVTTTFEDPELIAVFPVAAAIMQRALELDPDWELGAIHEVMISLAPNLPEPGGDERAQEHYRRALALQDGLKAGPHVSYATAVALGNQDKARFVELLNMALEVDLDAAPEHRLANDYAQQKARFLLDNLDELFFE